MQEKPGHSSACDSVPARPPLPLSLSPSKPQHRPPLLASLASLKRLRVPPTEQQRPLLHARGVQALGFPLCAACNHTSRRAAAGPRRRAYWKTPRPTQGKKEAPISGEPERILLFSDLLVTQTAGKTQSPGQALSFKYEN